MLQVLKKHKKAIGWTLIDILGISLSMGMRRILFEDGEKSARQPQMRLNPLILYVVKIETYIVPEDKEKTTFTCSFNIFTHRRMFFDPGIKSEGTDKSFNFNGLLLKLFYESPILEEEII